MWSVSLSSRSNATGANEGGRDLTGWGSPATRAGRSAPRLCRWLACGPRLRGRCGPFRSRQHGAPARVEKQPVEAGGQRRLPANAASGLAVAASRTCEICCLTVISKGRPRPPAGLPVAARPDCAPGCSAVCICCFFRRICPAGSRAPGRMSYLSLFPPGVILRRVSSVPGPAAIGGARKSDACIIVCLGENPPGTPVRNRRWVAETRLQFA